jgi:hypothetical protein
MVQINVQHGGASFFRYAVANMTLTHSRRPDATPVNIIDTQYPVSYIPLARIDGYPLTAETNSFETHLREG